MTEVSAGSPSSEDVAYFKNAIHGFLGLQFDESRWDFLADVLRQRIEETGSGEAPLYFARFGSQLEARAEFRILATRLTVSETDFFRNPDLFRALFVAVLSACVRSFSGKKQLRVHVAECVSGEEVSSYSMM